MGKLHEILAVERSKVNAITKLMNDSIMKFGKFDYFQGHSKTLKMLEDSPQNSAIESASADFRNLPTTVEETLEYLMKFWVEVEDIIFQKNCTNQKAVADIEFRDSVIATNVPVDELMGLEKRLEALRRIFEAMPTLNAGTVWEVDKMSGRPGAWVSEKPEITIKTEKTTTPVVLYEATDKHPAQVKEVNVDRTVGQFEIIKMCGAASSAQKASAMTIIDELIAEVKKARVRANNIEVENRKIGKTISDIIMAAFKESN